MSGPSLISIIIPVYNGAMYLAEAIESVWRQHYRPIEIIVVDDGSTDNTREVAAAARPPCRYCYQPNQGPPAARNQGLRVAQGDIIALLDADDIWPQDKLELQLPYLLEDTRVEMIIGNTQYFRVLPAREHQPAIVEYAQPFFIIQLGCALFRRSVFNKVGFFDPELRYGDDFDFLLRTREQHIITKYIDKTTILYRRHTSNMTIAQGHRSLSFLAMMKRSLDRRRAQGKDHLPLPSWFN